MLLCIDIGNTHTHYGLVNTDTAADADGGAPADAATPATLAQHDTPTRTLDDPVAGIGPKITTLLAHRGTGCQPVIPGAQMSAHASPRAGSPCHDKDNHDFQIEGLAYCSVVPAATKCLRAMLERLKFPHPVLHLTHDKNLGVPIAYPRPAEIGQDRLANAAAAKTLGPLPAIVIDMGTAVTFDIITAARGYEGGIIAPGVELMRRYLHEQTAQLPLLDETTDLAAAPIGPIGRTTTEAMRIGTVIGFGGMITALLDAVLADLAARNEPPPRIYATGGTAALLRDRLKTPFAIVPDLTLRGLAAAWKLNTPLRA